MRWALLSGPWAWAGVSGVALLIVWLLLPVLPPFLVAAGLAYLLYHPVQLLRARGVPKVLAVLLVECVAVLAVLAVLLLVVPVLLHELPLLREQVPRLAADLNAAMGPHLERWGIPFTLDVPALKALMLKAFGGNRDEWIAAALNSVRIGGSVALAVLGYAVLVPVAVYYLLLDARRISATVAAQIPPRLRAPIGSFLSEADALIGHYLRGQLLVMLGLAAFYTVALVLCGLELAVPVGVFSGLAVVVPYIGFGIGVVLALMASVLQFGLAAGLLQVALVYAVGQFLESFVLTPRWVGDRIGLSPLAVIFALLVFGEWFGFVGILLALPASAVLLVLLRRVGALYRSSAFFLGPP